MALLVAGDNSPGYKTVDRSYFTATAGQTAFTVTQGYQVGDIDVYLNGIRLLDGDDYTATNGSTIFLTSGANLGDSLSVIAYTQFNVAGSYTKAESDNKYLNLSGGTMSSYIRTPNYGVSSYSDSASASLEASAGLGTQGAAIKVHGRSMSTFGGDIHHVTDTRGAGGGHKFYGWNGTAAVGYGGFDSSGRWTNPLQPMVSVGNNGWTATATGQKFTGWATPGVNVGGGWSAANSQFNCPITGYYSFSLYFLTVAGSNAGDHRLTKNGTVITGGYSSNNVAGYLQAKSECIVYCSAGDALYPVSQGTTAVHPDANHNQLVIRLVG
jgi:hypothetical protein